MVRVAGFVFVDACGDASPKIFSPLPLPSFLFLPPTMNDDVALLPTVDLYLCLEHPLSKSEVVLSL